MDKKYDSSFPYKDIPAIPETFADGIHLVTLDGATARMTFTVSRSDPPKPGHKGPPTGMKATAARLVLPTPAYIDLYNQMSQMIAGLEARGLIHREGQAWKSTVQ